MTLNTKVAIYGDIIPRRALQLALEAICYAAQENERIATARIGEPSAVSDGTYWVATECGQGLPAWTGCTYREEGPLYPVDHYELDEYDDSGEAHFVAPASNVIIDWDTTYGYRGPGGMTCSTLHAIAIAYVHAYVTELGYQMHWHNEYRGEWHPGIEGLDQFAGDGFAADEWFRGVALPAIATMAALPAAPQTAGECQS